MKNVKRFALPLIAVAVFAIAVLINPASADCSCNRTISDDLFAVATETPNQTAREDSVGLPPLNLELEKANVQQNNKQPAGTPYSAMLDNESTASDLAMNTGNADVNQPSGAPKIFSKAPPFPNPRLLILANQNVLAPIRKIPRREIPFV